MSEFPVPDQRRELLALYDRAAPADEWDVLLDAAVAHQTLARLSANHRSALTLRYLDGLPVAEVARHLGRTVGATEVLLVRAKAAFRHQYDVVEGER